MDQDDPDFAVKTALRRYGVFQEIERAYGYRRETPFFALWDPDIKKARSQTSEAVVVLMPPTPLESRGSLVEIEFSWLDPTSISKKVGKFGDGSHLDLTYVHMTALRPECVRIRGKVEVEMTFQSEANVSLTTGGKALKVPLDEMIEDRLKRGFVTDVCAYSQAAMVVEFGWRVALGDIAVPGSDVLELPKKKRWPWSA